MRARFSSKAIFLCGGGVPSSHPSLGLSVFFLSFVCVVAGPRCPIPMVSLNFAACRYETRAHTTPTCWTSSERFAPHSRRCQAWSASSWRSAQSAAQRPSQSGSGAHARQSGRHGPSRLTAAGDMHNRQHSPLRLPNDYKARRLAPRVSATPRRPITSAVGEPDASTTLPAQAFLLSSDGLLLRWSVLHCRQRLPIGHM